LITVLLNKKTDLRAVTLILQLLPLETGMPYLVLQLQTKKSHHLRFGQKNHFHQTELNIAAAPPYGSETGYISRNNSD
jgi:hypothetical protein